LVSFIISTLGWSHLASKYKIEPNSFIGNRIGIISAKINIANYNSCF